MKAKDKNAIQSCLKENCKFANTLEKLGLITKGQCNQIHNINVKALDKLEKNYKEIEYGQDICL